MPISWISEIAHASLTKHSGDKGFSSSRVKGLTEYTGGDKGLCQRACVSLADHFAPPRNAVVDNVNDPVMARPLDVVIVGGGIGGLSAAIAIRLAGHNVVVLEAAEKIEEVRPSGLSPLFKMQRSPSLLLSCNKTNSELLRDADRRRSPVLSQRDPDPGAMGSGQVDTGRRRGAAQLYHEAVARRTDDR